MRELTPQQLSAEWKAGRFRPVYYLFGEPSAARAAATKLKEALKPDPFNLDEFADPNPDGGTVVGACLTPPLMAGRRLVAVRSPRLGAEAKKALAAYLADPLESTTLVLFSEERKPDIRDVLAAAAAALGGVAVFRPMREGEAAARLVEAAAEAGRELGADAAELVVSEAGTDWSVLAAELEKMVLFTRGRRRISREDALACLGYRRESDPFAFANAVQTRDRARCMKALRRLIEDGVEPLRLLSQMASTLNRMLKARRMSEAGMPEAEIYAAIRIPAYYGPELLKASAQAGERRLRAALRECLELESRLKSESWLDPAIELERLTVSVCRAPASPPPGGLSGR